jgi:hypothetical protein
MAALLLVVAWCILPLAVPGYLAETGLLPEVFIEPLRFASPITVISTAEAIGRRATEPAVTSDMVVMAFLHLGLTTVIMWSVRRQCLENADRYLGRI